MKRTEIAFFLTFLSVAYSFIALASVAVFIMQGMRWNTQDTPWVVSQSRSHASFISHSIYLIY